MAIARHKSELFDLLNSLTKINEIVVFNKPQDDSADLDFNSEAENVVIRMWDDTKTMGYFVEAPKDYFDIDNKIGFYNFAEFYQFYKQNKKSELELEPRSIVIKGDNSKMRYTLSDLTHLEQFMIKGKATANFDEYEYEFELAADTIAEIKKAMGLIVKNTREGTVRFVSNPDKTSVAISVRNTGSDEDSNEDGGNSFEKRIPLVCMQEVETLDCDIIAQHIERLPVGKDFNVRIKNGRFRLEWHDEDLKLEIYTRQKKR